MEEIKRDEQFRAQMLATQNKPNLDRANAPTGISMPPVPTDAWGNGSHNGTPRAGGINGRNPITPGLAISLATPAIHAGNVPPLPRDLGSPIAEEDATGLSAVGSASGDYFTANGRSPNPNPISPNLGVNDPATPALSAEEAKTPAVDSKDDHPDQKDTPSKFGKKFGMKRMNMSFSMKKLGRTSTNTDKDKAKEKEKEDESDTQSEKTTDSRHIDENFTGAIQKIRLEYKDRLSAHNQNPTQEKSAEENSGITVGPSGEVDIETLITPSLPNETPVLKPPHNTGILIQEDKPEAGGIVDLYEGTVGSIAAHVDQIERVAPMWLGEILLRNQLPAKDVVKISFVLDPWQNQLPQIATDG